MQGIDSVERNDLKCVELLSVSIKHALTIWKHLPGMLQAEQSMGEAKQMELHVSRQLLGSTRPDEVRTRTGCLTCRTKFLSTSASRSYSDG